VSTFYQPQHSCTRPHHDYHYNDYYYTYHDHYNSNDDDYNYNNSTAAFISWSVRVTDKFTVASWARGGGI